MVQWLHNFWLCVQQRELAIFFFFKYNIMKVLLLKRIFTLLTQIYYLSQVLNFGAKPLYKIYL